MGTFQDAGLLINDPIATAYSETAALYPSVPIDLILSLGTGKIADAEYDPSSEIAAAVPRAPYRVRDLAWEKSRDEQVRQAFAHHPRYHRLDHEMDRDHSLDSVNHMLKLKSDVEHSASLSAPIERVAGCAVASLFYFELVGPPRRSDRQFVGSGRIVCSVLGKDSNFATLLSRLSIGRAQFSFNGVPLPGVWDDQSLLDPDGNFCRRVDFETGDQISISLRMGDGPEDKYDISGLPSTINGLIRAQNLEAYFGTQTHQKRKRSTSNECCSIKKRRMWIGTG